MTPYTLRRRNIGFAVIGCIFFFCAGLAFIPRLGIESDEALFAGALFQPRGELFSLSVFHNAVPLMLMTYLGTLKSWIYAPLFHWFGTGLLTLRVPMLLAGTISIWLFFLLLRRVAGDRAALIGCSLLALDSVYLLTVCFDWGPVALQHLLLGAGMLLLMRFYQEKSEQSLVWAGVCLGLALWDKALALWMLSGMGLAIIVTFPRQVFGAITRRRVAIAALGFLLGATPLLIYNIRNHWTTFRGNFHRDTSQMAAKARALRSTATGHGLFGWMTAEEWQTPKPHPPVNVLERASADISALAGHPRQGLALYGFALALLLAPFARGPALRTILFALIAIAVAWIQMAVTQNAGASVHHTILLWPLPQLVMAVSFSSFAERFGRAGIPAIALVMVLVLGSDLLTMNEYFTVVQQYGPAHTWDDAIFALSDYAKTQPSAHLLAMDWGITDPLRLIGHGTFPISGGDDPISKPELSADDRATLQAMIADTSNLYIAHTKDFEFFPGVSAKLIQFAGEAGFRQEIVKVIDDQFGRQVFEVYRFVH